MTAPKPGKGARAKASHHWSVCTQDGRMCFGYQAAAMIYETEGECRSRADFAKMREQVLPVAVLPCATVAQARRVVRLHNFKDPGVRALAQATEALKGCKNRRELNATISFIVDYFITHPSPELPAHLSRLTPPAK